MSFPHTPETSDVDAIQGGTSLRRRSLLLSSLPWTTDCVMRPTLRDGFDAPADVPQKLLRAINLMENEVLTSQSLEFVGIRNLMQLDEEGPLEQQIWSLDRAKAKILLSRLLSILVSFRLLDVMSWMANTPSGKVPHIPRAPVVGVHAKKGWSKMQDWVALLTRFESMSPDVRGLHALLPASNEVEFLRSSVNLYKGKESAKVLSNINMAAFYVHFLLKGHTDFPEKMPELLNLIATEDSSLSSEDRSILLNEMGATTQRLRLPLQLALCVSPLFLLVPELLHRKDFSRRDLLITWIAFGNQAPAIVRRVEFLLWQAILRVACGQQDIAGSMTAFISEVPWPELRKIKIEDAERKWFQTKELDGSEHPKVDRIQIEGSLPEGWPLVLRGAFGGGCGSGEGVRAQTSATPLPSNRGSFALRGNLTLRGPLTSEEAADPRADDIANDGTEGGGSGALPRSVKSAQGNLLASPPPNSISMDISHDQDQSFRSGSVNRALSTLPGSDSPLSSPFANSDGSEGEGEGRSGGEDGGSWGPKKRKALRDDSSDEEHSDSRPEDKPGGENQDRGSSGTKKRKTRHDGDLSDEEDDGSRPSPGTKKMRYRVIAFKPVSKVKKSRKMSPRRPELKPRQNLRNEGEEGDTIWRPIYISDDAPSPDLDVKSTPPKFHGSPITAYGPAGDGHTFVPTFHAAEDVGRFSAFVSAIEASYVDGKPLHVARPSESVLAVYSDQEFNLMTDKEVLEVLRHKHILVTDRPRQPFGFDEDGLSQLKLLTFPVTIQDQSITAGDNFNVRCKIGTLQQMLECANMDGGGGKILNALQFPLGETDLSPMSFTTETHAWKATKDAAFCKTDQPFPGDDLRWGLAATSGALHWYHIDSDGFGTFVDVKTGIKYWILPGPKRSQGIERCHKPFSRTSTFLSTFDVNIPCADEWDLEAVVLTPGTRLIMRPNTPHAVYTPDHAICMGGHFYATSTMQSTMFGLIHTFMAGLLVTNTEHLVSRNLIRRIALFYHTMLVVGQAPVLRAPVLTAHVPDLETAEGVLDLLTVCALTELANVLNVQTYTQDGMTPRGRAECQHARGRTREMLHWFFARYELVDASSGRLLDGMHEVYWRYMVHIVNGLLSYKEASTKQKLGNSEKKCTLAALKLQVKHCFEGVEAYERAYLRWGAIITDSLAWPENAKFTVKKRLEEPAPCDKVFDGMTADDRMFDEAWKKNRRMD